MARFVVREGWVVQAYRYALDPSPRQERALASHAGAARVAYNWAVSWVLATWAQCKAEESYGVPEDERTPWRGWSLPTLRKEWNQVKNDVAPWWAQNSKEAYSSGLAGAAAAFDNYAASKSGRRRGRRWGARGVRPSTVRRGRAGSRRGRSGWRATVIMCGCRGWA